MLDAHVRYGPGDRRELEVVEVPAWAVIVEHLADRACGLTRHALCGNWEWTYHVRIGREIRTHDLQPWNLGNQLYRLGQCTLSVAARRQTPLFSFPVSQAFVDEHFPSSVTFDDLDED